MQYLLLEGLAEVGGGEGEEGGPHLNCTKVFVRVLGQVVMVTGLCWGIIFFRSDRYWCWYIS